MDADVSKTNDADADGEVVWSWRALAGVKSAMMLTHRGLRRWQTLVHRGEREVSRKTIAQRGPVDSAFTCGLRALRATFLREGPRVPGGHPAFPAPSPIDEGTDCRKTSGARRCGNAGLCPLRYLKGASRRGQMRRSRAFGFEGAGCLGLWSVGVFDRGITGLRT